MIEAAAILANVDRAGKIVSAFWHRSNQERLHALPGKDLAERVGWCFWVEVQDSGIGHTVPQTVHSSSETMEGGPAEQSTPGGIVEAPSWHGKREKTLRRVIMELAVIVSNHHIDRQYVSF